MPSRAILMMTHIASQLMYRWLAPPSDELQKGTDDDIISANFGTSYWYEFIRHAVQHSDYVKGWWTKYKKRTGDDGRGLASAISMHLAATADADARYVVWSDPDYPASLRRIVDPPLGLTYTGSPEVFSYNSVSVVGSRKASAYAVHQSFALGRELAARGIAVVSGGAFGCDIASHHGVLAVNTRPAPAIAIFAGGLGRLYPTANQPVFSRLINRSAVMLSERIWGAPCRPLDFTARNRLIAGLSSVTVVMQAAARSGALVTARRALDQGAEVLVMRHPDGDVRALGSSSLLADGARGFADARELCQWIEGDLRPLSGQF